MIGCSAYSKFSKCSSCLEGFHLEGGNRSEINDDSYFILDYYGAFEKCP